MIYLKTYEYFSNDVDISLICDIFSDLLDQDTNIWIWQFPFYNDKSGSPSDTWDKLNYIGTDEGDITKFTKNKEYWIDVDVEIKRVDDLSDSETRRRLKEVERNIKNYDWDSIIGRLDDIGILSTIEKSITLTTSWSNTEIITDKVRVVCRLK